MSGAVVCYLRHRSGLDVPVIKNATAVKDEQGRLWGIIGAITDITELEKARNKVLDAGRRSGEIHGLDKIIGKAAGTLNIIRTTVWKYMKQWDIHFNPSALGRIKKCQNG